MVTWSCAVRKYLLGFLDALLELVLVVQLEAFVDGVCGGTANDGTHGVPGRCVVMK